MSGQYMGGAAHVNLPALAYPNSQSSYYSNEGSSSKGSPEELPHYPAHVYRPIMNFSSNDDIDSFTRNS